MSAAASRLQPSIAQGVSYNARMPRSPFELSNVVLLVLALILAGMLQVLIPQEQVARYFGQKSGIRAIILASVAGLLTPGGPMVSVPLLVVLANSGMALGPLVAYMTSWSLFGVQRIIAWEAPLMGWHFVMVRAVSSLAFPILAGYLVKLYYHE